MYIYIYISNNLDPVPKCMSLLFFLKHGTLFIHDNDALAASVFLSTSIDGESRRFDTCRGHPAVKKPISRPMSRPSCLMVSPLLRTLAMCFFESPGIWFTGENPDSSIVFHLQVATSRLLRLVITIHTELHFFEVLSEFIPCTISGTQCMVHCLCIAQNNYHVL